MSDVSLPPPLPPQRTSVSQILGLVLFLVALLMCAAPFAGVGESVLGALGAGVCGILATGGALVCGIVAVTGKRGRLLSMLLLVGSLAAGVYLILQVQRSVTVLANQARSAPSSQGTPIAAQAIPQTTASPVAAQLRPAREAWIEETMVQPYEQHGRHGAWDEAARGLVRGSALVLTRTPGAPGTEALRKLSREVELAGCDDPWISFLIRRLEENDPDYRELLEQAAAQMAAAGYAGMPLWLARTQVFAVAQEESQEQAPAMIPACLEAFRSALGTKPLEAADYDAWPELMGYGPVDDLFKRAGEDMCRALEGKPETAEWFRLQMRGRYEIILAWESRSSAYANQVSEAQWKGFREHLAKARQILEKSWKLQPHPATARHMMTVELGSGGLADMRTWFDRAVQARFDYIPAYDNFRKGLLPRWNGSEEALLTFGRTCLATQRFDTAVPWQMMSAAHDVADERNNRDAYFAGPAPWRDLRAMLEGYAQHGDPARRAYYWSVEAVIAQRRGADDVVAEMLKRLDYRIDPQVAEDWNLGGGWIGRMMALTGPSADQARDALNLKNEHPDQSVVLLEKALQPPTLAPAAREYLSRQLEQTRGELGLHAARWQPLSPGGDLAGWEKSGGEWRLASPGVLEVKTGTGGSRLVRVQPVGASWELKGVIELVPHSAQRAEAAVFCGPLGEQEPHWFCLRFWARPHGSSGVSLTRGPHAAALNKMTNFEERIPFLIQLLNGRLRVQANGGQWLADQPLPDGVAVDAGALLGIGSTGGGESLVRFRNLEWRTAETR